MTKIEAQADERLFTVNCALSLCGQAKKRKGVLPIKKEIMEPIQEKEIRNRKELCEKINNSPKFFIKSFPAYLSNPPELKLERKPVGTIDYMKEEYENLKGLEKHLRIFYKKAELSKLWEKNKERYQDYIETLRNSIKTQKPVKKTLNFLRIDPSFKEIQCTVSGLDGMSLGVPLSNDKAYIIMGVPTDSKRELSYAYTLSHELIHLLLKSAVKENEELMKQSSWREKDVPQKYLYSTWKSYIEEVIARVIDVYIYKLNQEEISKKVQQLEENGFIHAPLISREIERYKESNKNFLEYLPELLKRIAER